MWRTFLGCARRQQQARRRTVEIKISTWDYHLFRSPQLIPPTAATIALGRKLFYEVKLSADASVSCASCHNPALGFTDRRRHSTGVGGKEGARNAPTVINAAYVPAQFWDGRASSLEEQAGGPIANPIEMNQAHDVCVSKLNADPS